MEQELVAMVSQDAVVRVAHAVRWRWLLQRPWSKPHTIALLGTEPEGGQQGLSGLERPSRACGWLLGARGRARFISAKS
jgi:hypothetical protein